MKEIYFTIESIAVQAAALLDEVDYLRQRHPFDLQPQSAALLVLDMQDYFLKEHSHAFVPSAPAVLPHIVHMQKLFLEKKLKVIQTRHVNDPAQAGMMPKWWRELLTHTHPLSRITAELIDPEAFIVEKTQYDAFYETGLAAILAAQGVRQVIITGVLTHLCCETTARSAFVHGFEVFFPVDGTADNNRQFHQATLLNLAHGFARPVLMEELTVYLEKEYGP
ncbi:MAG: isochorismatase family protein [Desulfobacteraceae bacterium]|nr:MAG: isochorismatase family protein [Desulfobacteraceae bacterium]